MDPAGQARIERRLAAILAADVAGYSRLIGADEGGTLERLRALRRELLDPKIAEHRGRLVKTTGDGLLVEFGSVVDALRCAVEVQREMAGRNAGVPPDNRIEFRIGINVGDIVVEDGDIFGDGVNVAARLEALAEPGGICVSARVQEDAAGRLDLAFEDIGERTLKNHAARPDIPCGDGCRRSIHAGESRPSPPRQAVDRGASVRQLERRPGAGIFRRRHGRGDHHCAQPHPLAVRDRAEFVLHLQRPIGRRKQVGRELGVRYILEGSVRKAGGRVRITGQLIDAATGAHLWADRFDGSLEDVFDLQDKVARSVAGVIEPALQAAETVRSANRPTNDLTAYDFYLRALSVVFPITKERVFEALGLLEQAIVIDRRYALALSWAAICHMWLLREGWAAAPEANRGRANDLARLALEPAENDPRILVNAALVLASFGEDIAAMIGLVDRALAVNPSFARGWYVSGILRTFAGQHDLAIEHLEASLRLSPRERVGQPLSVIGTAYFFKRRFEEAAAQLRLAIQDHPGFPLAHRALAACYAHMGLLDEARAIVAKLRAITPLLVPSEVPFRNPEDRDLFLSGLRLAAGETV